MSENIHKDLFTVAIIFTVSKSPSVSRTRLTEKWCY